VTIKNTITVGNVAADSVYKCVSSWVIYHCHCDRFYENSFFLTK